MPGFSAHVLNAFGYWLRAGKPLAENVVIDRIIVWKSRRIMHVYEGDRLLKTYPIALGKNPIGHKQFEGDNRTPEGTYAITGRNSSSRFYKNLGISYPSQTDIENAEKLGKPAGGDIKIHGLRNGQAYRAKLHHFSDWTAGCIAVTNRQMEELYDCVADGASIEIHP